MTGWILNEGDCLDPDTGMAPLADRSVDHVIADPPYSEHVHANLGREDRDDGAVDREALRFSCLTSETASAVAAHACRIAKRWIIAFCDEPAVFMWRQAINAAGGLYVRCGTWVKSDPMPQMTGDRPCAGTEAIVIAHAPRERGRMKWNGGGATRHLPWIGS